MEGTPYNGAVQTTNNTLISNFTLHDLPAELCRQVMKTKKNMTSFVSIGFCPGAAQGAWKHAPVILLPRSDALLQAHPPYFFLTVQSTQAVSTT